MHCPNSPVAKLACKQQNKILNSLCLETLLHLLWQHPQQEKVDKGEKSQHKGHNLASITDTASRLHAGSAPKPKLLIANRGEITRRVIRSAKALGIPTVVVFTEPDALSLHVKDGDEAVCLGSSPKEYTNAQKLLEVAKTTKYA